MMLSRLFQAHHAEPLIFRFSLEELPCPVPGEKRIDGGDEGRYQSALLIIFPVQISGGTG